MESSSKTCDSRTVNTMGMPGRPGKAVLLFAWLLAVCPALSAVEPLPRPNIVFILCDDLGYGDVKCLNPDGKIATPRMDQIAKEGMTFTDAHSGSGVCSPTRYGVMTGRYAWRSKLQSGVLGGLSPRLIEQDRLTVAQMLKNVGYHTACVGKWHLGMDWVKLPGKEVTELNIEPLEQNRNVDYSRPITNGPNAVGFDEYFGISASLDMVPYAFIENDHLTAQPTEENAFAMMFGRQGGKTRLGPAAPGFEASDVLPTLAQRAVTTIESQAAAAQKKGRPFFLYLPLASPHTPILPTSDWQGKSGLSPYADFVMQTDYVIGQVMDAIDKHGLAENTLLIITSDNGCSPQADFPELLKLGHNPSYHFRGHKADIYEGGHRVPFLARWKSHVAAGSRCDDTICLTDLMATCADITGTRLPDTAAEDSVSFLPALRGVTARPQRPAVVHHSINGSFAIRDGQWKLALCPGSGGWSQPGPGKEPDGSPPVQLFDLAKDIGEQTNLVDQHPELVTRLTQLLEQFVANGRSTPGEPQANTVPVRLVKAGPKPKRP
jgi:arylsulfatase A